MHKNSSRCSTIVSRLRLAMFMYVHVHTDKIRHNKHECILVVHLFAFILQDMQEDSVSCKGEEGMRHLVTVARDQ